MNDTLTTSAPQKTQTQTLHFEDVISNMNRDSSLQADEWIKSGKTPGFWSTALKAKWLFLSTYLFQGKIFKGISGFQAAMNQSIFCWMCYAKFWEAKEQKAGRM